ncbi:S-layer homology domain-containing protein [Candidatus Peregrinibacteria bacterium]|nr:S-layer homology domain-containing protein [Candidatus Peregrinibacteria bacterium]
MKLHRGAATLHLVLDVARLHRHAFLLGAGVLALLVFAPVTFAQGTGSSIPVNTVTVEQTGHEGTIGTWELLMPDQTSVRFKSANHTVTVYKTGNYTFFATSPEGMSAKVTLFKGDTIVTSLDRPQVSFVVSEGEPPYKISINYVLSRTGDVGINSTPSGVPFEVKGPNNMTIEGTTPYSLLHTPVGQYVVQYLPPGCIKPRPQSQLLQKDGRLNFQLTIECDALPIPEHEEEDSDEVKAIVGGENVTFTDVPQSGWFAHYVFTVVKGGVMSGYKDPQGNPVGRFGPENPVTTGELAKLAHEVAGIDEEKTNTRAQNRMAAGEWFAPYIASAEALDWLIYQDTQIDLLRPATRGEVIVTLLQALDIPLEWPKGDLFIDVTRRTTYSAAIETAARAKIVSGSTDEQGKLLFRPQAPINRAEIAKILSILIDEYKRAK